MNVEEAWAAGATGKGIVVTILDDGLEKDHPDLAENYVSYMYIYIFDINIKCKNSKLLFLKFHCFSL